MNTMVANRTRNGFTLVEVLIVVVIMGILASTVVPQFVDVGDDANLKSRDFNLRQIRSQIMMYKAKEGTHPSSLNDLVGDYLDAIPVNSITGTATYWDTAAPPNSQDLTENPVDAGAGWWYNTNTGRVWAFTNE